MIASIFKKSKPINFVIVLMAVLALFVYANLVFVKQPLSLVLVGRQTLVFCISVFTMFLLNFIVIKNKLIEQSSYHILLFGLFMALFPITLVSVKMLLANTFVLLALRRLISIQSQIEVKKKLFDAGFWLAIATLFYFWSGLFVLLIFMTLLLFSETRIKNWIVPFVGIATVAILLVAYQLVRFDSVAGLYDFLPTFNFDFSYYGTVTLILPISLVLGLGLWSTFYYVASLKDKTRTSKPSRKIIALAVILGLAIVVLSDEKGTSEFIFMFAPLSITIGSYLETIRKNWVREVLLSVYILSALILLVL